MILFTKSQTDAVVPHRVLNLSAWQDKTKTNGTKIAKLGTGMVNHDTSPTS